jgi:hypothetical protein
MSGASYGTLADCTAAAVAHIRNGRRVDPQIVIGPVVWELVGDLRRWYFVVASADRKGARFDQLACPNETLAKEFRFAIYMTLLLQKPAIIIHDMDDELEMARLCETIWPSRKTTKIRADIEAERRWSAR